MYDYYSIIFEIKPMFNISNSETSFVYSKSSLWEVLHLSLITVSYVCEEKYY